MITFASEIVNHLTGLENPVKKERKKRNRREQIKQQQDRMDLMTRAIETLTVKTHSKTNKQTDSS